MNEDHIKYELLVKKLVECTVVMQDVIDRYFPNHLSGDFSYRISDKTVVEEVLMPAIDEYVYIGMEYLNNLENLRFLCISGFTLFNIESLRVNFKHIVMIYKYLFDDQGC